MSRRVNKLRTIGNEIGQRGESIFYLKITGCDASGMRCFDAAFLGEKWPAADFLVETKGGRVRGTMLVQVKTTCEAISASKKALLISLPPAKLKRFRALPGPTYLIGVHEPTERAFVKAVLPTQMNGIYEIPVANELDGDNLRRLRDEVIAFWRQHPRKPKNSTFA